MESTSDEKAERKKEFVWWEHVASLIAVLSLASLFFGYGVVTGLASAVGLDQGTLVTGIFDVVTLVWPGMFAVITSMSDLPWTHILMDAVRRSSGSSLALGVVVFLVLMTFRFRPLFERVLAAGSRLFTDFKSRQTPTRRALAAAALSAMAAFALSIVLSTLSVAAIFITIVALTFLPSIGFLSGQAYVQKVVVEPEHCASTPTRSQRMDHQAESRRMRDAGGKPKQVVFGAPCVFVTSVEPGKASPRFGRSVIASGSSVLIWNPESGRGERIPISAMTITSIDQGQFETLMRTADASDLPSARTTATEGSAPRAAAQSNRRSD